MRPKHWISFIIDHLVIIWRCALIISDLDFLRSISGQIAGEKRWVVALSGGADSMCLIMLAHAYSLANGVDLYAVIVDHKLRPESSSEIVPIIDILNEKGIKNRVFVWEHPCDLGGGIEAKARAARYKILLDFCKEIECRVIMTAHHSLDQWETFFMRLSRGSSVKGLSSIRSLSLIGGNIFLVRPLIKFDPASLKETLAQRFGINRFVKDRSNKDMRFERVRWRAAYNDLSEKYGLSTEFINKSVSRIQVADDCLNEMSHKIVAEIFDGKYIEIVRFKGLHIELQMRSLDIIISKVSDKNMINSYELLRRVSLQICDDFFRCTNLGGVILRKDRTKNISVSREIR
jgi:tRNA(Ile)-lysidine synthase